MSEERTCNPAVTIVDQSGGGRKISVQLKAEGDCAALAICPEGYGRFDCVPGTSGPVVLELYEGRLRLLVWADINEESPTHFIDLEDAREPESTR